MKTTNETRTAYHEAGHAVAAFFAHIAVKSVTVVPDKDTSGRVKHYRTPSFRPDVNADARTNQRALAHILVDLAGPAAEREIGGRAFRHATSRQDYQNAVDLATLLCGSNESVNALLRWGHDRILSATTASTCILSSRFVDCKSQVTTKRRSP